MRTKEQLEKYRKELRVLEEQEATLTSLQRKGQELAETTYSELVPIVNKFAETNEPLVFARQQFGKLEAEFLEEISHMKRKVSNQKEALEHSYRQLKQQTEKNNQ